MDSNLVKYNTKTPGNGKPAPAKTIMPAKWVDRPRVPKVSSLAPTHEPGTHKRVTDSLMKPTAP